MWLSEAFKDKMRVQRESETDFDNSDGILLAFLINQLEQDGKAKSIEELEAAIGSILTGSSQLRQGLTSPIHFR